MECTIALLSQPNAGKSTLFNGLTGARQHVGNWPGKTVEKKEGEFLFEGRHIRIMDLPGSYSLSANSDEEMITRDFIASKEADIVCLLCDASQLERSLFMLADFCGMDKPVMLVLNMMDVALSKEIRINVDGLAERLGIPVARMSATDKKTYKAFYDKLGGALHAPCTLSSKNLDTIYEEILGPPYAVVRNMLPDSGLDGYGPIWIAAKLVEGDVPAWKLAEKLLSKKQLEQVAHLLEGISDGKVLASSAKFRWIDTIIADCVTRENSQPIPKLSRFDRIITDAFWGKSLSIVIILVGLLVSFVPAYPFMMLGMAIPTSVSPVVASYLASIGVARILVEIIAEVLLASFGFCLAMVGFVLGVSFVFGLMEETGLMARISYVFDDTMHGMGLQGKSLMPILVSFGCNMAGTAAGRVIDSWGQKTLTIAMAWAIPCGASWSVFGLLASTFFAGEAPIVMVAFFLVLLFQIRLTAKVFSSRLVPENTQQGLIMELPPYHRPRWLDLLKFVFARFFKVFKKAFSVVFFVCLFIWALSYSASDNPQGSLLVRFGTAVEPVTMFFGLRWQLFVAWICSAMGKESAVGVLAALFSVSDNGIFLSEAMKYAGGTGLGAAMAAAVTKPEALAFLFAFMFNIPCFMTVISTNQEIHSWKWTLRIALFYIVSALVYAFVAYHVGLLIWR